MFFHGEEKREKAIFQWMITVITGVLFLMIFTDTLIYSDWILISFHGVHHGPSCRDKRLEKATIFSSNPIPMDFCGTN
jgi:hypothetical protein